jgi:hypothetical protein
LIKVLKVLGCVETILSPFINQKLRDIHNDHYHGDEVSKIKEVIAKIYPYLNLAMTASNALIKLGYFLHFTEKFSVATAVLGVRYHSSSPPVRTTLSTVRGLIELLFPISMFYVQFVKQWSSIEGVSPYEATIKPPPPYKAGGGTPNICPICDGKFKIPTAVPTTGITYCYVCIFTHIQKSGACPVSHLPLGTSDLIKLNIR